LRLGCEEAEHLIASLKDPDININLDEVMDEPQKELRSSFSFHLLMNSLERRLITRIKRSQGSRGESRCGRFFLSGTGVRQDFTRSWVFLAPA